MSLPEIGSRNEAFLNFLATGLGTLPDPESRIEEFLDYICENGTYSEAEIKAMIADEYDSEETYALGAVVLHENELFKCTTAITEPEEWTAAHWTKKTVAQLIGEGGGGKPATGWAYSDLSNSVKASLDKADLAVTTYSLTDGTMTMAEIVELLAEINEDGLHVFFDTSTLGAQMYLCTIYVNDYSNPTVYRVHDCVTGKINIGTYSASMTLQQLLNGAVDDYVTITVTATTQDGVTVTGQTVSLRNGSSASAPVVQTKAYNGQPVSFIVPKNFAYFVSISDTLASHFNPTTATGTAATNTSVILTYSDVSHLTTFNDVKMAVAAGARDVLCGVEIADTWVDENGTSYSDPMIIAQVKQVETENDGTHWAAILQRKWATKNSIQFDAAEQVIATGTYAADLYYYTKSGDVFTLLVAGTDYNVGDEITGTVYKNSIRDTTVNLLRYGYNRYKDSAYRQYLNSDDAIGEWWEATHVGDVAPANLATTRGYKAGCSAALLAAVKPIKITCATNTVTDGGVVDAMYDDFWLPSGIEMYGSSNVGEGTYFPYWKEATGLDAPSDGANSNRIIYNIVNHSSASSCRLRSVNRSNSCYVWGCYATGTLGSYHSADNSYACAPACAIY